MPVVGDGVPAACKNRLAGFEPLVQEMANSRQPVHKFGRFKGIFKGLHVGTRVAFTGGVSRLLAILISVAALCRLQAAPLVLAEFPFQFREGLLWVKVSTPQSAKPLNFLLDSGAEVSVMNLAVAKQLGLPLANPIDVRGVEKSTVGYWTERTCVTAGGVALPGRYLALDLSKFSQSCEQPVDGLIGADFIKGRILQIDFATGKIRLLKGNILTSTKIPGLKLPLETGDGALCATARINGGQMQRFRLDTGCATALQWTTTSVPLKECSSKVAVGLVNMDIPQTQTTVRLGAHVFHNVPTGLHEKPIFDGEAGLIGNGLLSRFKTVTFDTLSGQLIFSNP